MNTVSGMTQKQGTLIPNRIFVGGVNENATDSELRQFFSSFGNVADCKIVFDRTGVSKGYGFVTFERQEDAQVLIRKDRKEGTRLIFKDRKLNIGEAVRKHTCQNNYFSKFDGTRSKSSESAAIFDPHCGMTTSPSVHYINGIPYVYQNGMALFNPPPGPIGFTATPQIFPMVPNYSQMVVVPQHSCLPPMAGYSPFPGAIMPVSMVSPVYGGNMNNANIECNPYPTTQQTVEHVGGGEPLALVPMSEAVSSPYQMSKMDVDSNYYGNSTLKRICTPTGLPPHYGLIVMPSPLFRLGHNAI